MYRILTIFGVLVCAAAFLEPSWAGEIRGRILITKVLTRKRLALPDYQMRGVPSPPKADEAAAIDEFSRSVVYWDEPSTAPATPISVKLVQQNTHFVPEILVVPVGSTVSFPNQDPIFHNVFSLSKAKQFDLGYYPAGQTRIEKFEKVGVVQVYCHIHHDMNAAILVVPNSTYVQPGKDGMFTFSGIPAGSQHIAVWHKSAGFFRKKIEVPETGAIEVSFTVPVPAAE